MGTKTISIMDDAYEILLRKKHNGESFSEVIRRITGVKRELMKFAGTWNDISNKDAEKMKEQILILRKKSTSELLKKLK
ncbi:antitoxin VapB family protein [Candidatus Woesearchaeota archaeon]|nr:antitoxin VapB family protein [Candidatus Woesearchaeota archaeon]